MPRYFFNARIGDKLLDDREGRLLRDPDQAWDTARTTIRQLLQTETVHAHLLNAVMEVTDDSGEVVLEFPFSEALLQTDWMGTRH